VALVNNIPTLASRLNGLSIANVVASSHSDDLNRRRCAIRRSPGEPAQRFDGGGLSVPAGKDPRARAIGYSVQTLEGDDGEGVLTPFLSTVRGPFVPSRSPSPCVSDALL